MTQLVSILIPAYNAQKWIRQTMESALGQSWPHKEIVVVDDGSTDMTLRILKSFESGIVKIVSQENRGGPAARNVALRHAQGDFIQWLDHDDILDPDKIKSQLQSQKYDGDPGTLLSGSFAQFYFSTARARFHSGPLWRDLAPIDYFLIKFGQNTWIHPSVWLASRELTEAAGPWTELRSPYDDGEYFCRVVAACKRIVFVPEAKSYWRVGNAKSMNRSRSEEAIEAMYATTVLSITQFRSLEDSPRTRMACLQCLQDTFNSMGPNFRDVQEKVRRLARELGGSVFLEPLRPRYRLLGRALGRQIAGVMQAAIPALKESVVRGWDKLCFLISNQ
ncbi:MAG: glycosyltransferase family 2 protein [Syntrophobacteraceae bacterium]